MANDVLVAVVFILEIPIRERTISWKSGSHTIVVNRSPPTVNLRWLVAVAVVLIIKIAVWTGR